VVTPKPALFRAFRHDLSVTCLKLASRVKPSHAVRHFELGSGTGSKPCLHTTCQPPCLLPSLPTNLEPPESPPPSDQPYVLPTSALPTSLPTALSTALPLRPLRSPRPCSLHLCLRSPTPLHAFNVIRTNCRVCMDQIQRLRR
jgi:hypothetical protein